jgi:hypothetical protein
MSFLAPLFLAFLAALAIPVLIHLIQRERKQVVPFPSLMFLRRIPYESIRRRRIHNWLLLAMRLAALALIIAAFARPFVRRPDVAAASLGGAREVVVLLDRSYSMGYGDRWERARRAARDVVRSLGPGDRVSLVLFGTGADAPLRASTERAPVVAAIDAATLGSGTTRYGPALKLAERVLAESSLPRGEIVLISDFQRQGWRRDEGVRLTAGATIRPVPIGDRETANLLILSATFQRGSFSGQERVTVTAALANRGATPAPAVDVALELGGRRIQTERVSIAANGTASVTFDPFTLAGAFTRGTVRLPADRLPADNAFHFVVSPATPIPVLVIGRPGGSREAGLYLERALAIGSSPKFAVETRTADDAGAIDRGTRAVVIVNDVPIAPVLAARLEKFVNAGGGLLVVAGERGTWSDAAGVIPGSVGPLVDRSTGRGGTIGIGDYSHPVFELFKAPRSGDFSSTRFFRYRTIAPPDAARVLARFDDGAPALVEGAAGNGRVLVWASTLDTYWSDLPLKPVFLPFVQRTVTYLAGYVEPRPWLTVGQALDPSDPAMHRPGEPASRARQRVALTPAGRRVALGGPDRPAVLELDQQGFYELHPEAGDASPVTVAVNLDVAESDLTPLDPQEIVGSVTAGSAASRHAGQAGELTSADLERRQGLWWYLLVAGVLLLAAETFVSNRLSSRPR